MEYLPIVLKIPKRTYKIEILVRHLYTGRSPQGELEHIIRIFESDGKSISMFCRHDFRILNAIEVEKSIGMKLTKYYIERLKWFYGEDIQIDTTDNRSRTDSHWQSAAYHRARQTGKSYSKQEYYAAYEEALREHKQRMEDDYWNMYSRDGMTREDLKDLFDSKRRDEKDNPRW